MFGYYVRLAKANNDEFINVKRGMEEWRRRTKRGREVKTMPRSYMKNKNNFFINIIHTTGKNAT